MRPSLAAIALALALPSILAGCSIRKLAINKLGDALAESGTTFASDDDPQLVREALPFELKLVESLLAQSPRHKGLLVAATSGFTQYTYAFIQQDADEAEDSDSKGAAEIRARVRRLYLRAHGYALRALEIDHPGIGEALPRDPEGAVAAVTRKEEVPLLYWTAASWGLAISVSKDDPEMLADLRVVDALLHRAFALDAEYDHGAIEELLITFEGARSDAMGGSSERARRHFDRAVALSQGLRATPYVDLAESVSVKEQKRDEFVTLLRRALDVDPDARPEWRLSNLVAQRRARWLLGRIDLLFTE